MNASLAMFLQHVLCLFNCQIVKIFCLCKKLVFLWCFILLLVKDLLQVFRLYEALIWLAKVNLVDWYVDMLRREDGHVSRRVSALRCGMSCSEGVIDKDVERGIYEGWVKEKGFTLLI